MYPYVLGRTLREHMHKHVHVNICMCTGTKHTIHTNIDHTYTHTYMNMTHRINRHYTKPQRSTICISLPS